MCVFVAFKINYILHSNTNSVSYTHLDVYKRQLQLILKQNYFEFNSKIYQQKEGLAMGSPLSSIIAEIFLQDIDTKIQNIIKTHAPDGIWIRYVDDCLLYTSTQMQRTY